MRARTITRGRTAASNSFAAHQDEAENDDVDAALGTPDRGEQWNSTIVRLCNQLHG
jgi:hypothetical protein